MNHKMYAGWAALLFALVLSVEAAVARWYPLHTAAGNEALIITSLLAFAAAAFGVSAYEAVRKKE